VHPQSPSLTFSPVKYRNLFYPPLPSWICERTRIFPYGRRPHSPGESRHPITTGPRFFSSWFSIMIMDSLIFSDSWLRPILLLFCYQIIEGGTRFFFFFFDRQDLSGEAACRSRLLCRHVPSPTPSRVCPFNLFFSASTHLSRAPLAPFLTTTFYLLFGVFEIPQPIPFDSWTPTSVRSTLLSSYKFTRSRKLARILIEELLPPLPLLKAFPPIGRFPRPLRAIFWFSGQSAIGDVIPLPLSPEPYPQDATVIPIVL